MKQSRFNSCSVSKESLNFDKDVYPIICKKAEIRFRTHRGRGFYSLGDLIDTASDKAYRKLGTYDSRLSPLDAWLNTLVQNAWLDLLDEESRRNAHFVPLVLTNNEGDEYEQDGEFYSYDFEYATRSEMESAEDVEYIMDNVNSLPNDCQRRAMIRSIQGYDNEVIAQEFGMGKANVATCLCRARNGLEGLRKTYSYPRRKGE